MTDNNDIPPLVDSELRPLSTDNDYDREIKTDTGMRLLQATPIPKVRAVKVPLNWQPLIDGCSIWLNSKTFTALAITLFLVLLFGDERVAGWFEAIGSETLSRVFGVGV